MMGAPGSQEVPGCFSLEPWSDCQTGESTLTQHLTLSTSQTLPTFRNPQRIRKSYYTQFLVKDAQKQGVRLAFLKLVTIFSDFELQEC